MDIYSIRNRVDFQKLDESEQLAFIQLSLGDWTQPGYSTVYQLRRNTDKVRQEYEPYTTQDADSYNKSTKRGKKRVRTLLSLGDYISNSVGRNWKLTKTLEQIKKEASDIRKARPVSEEQKTRRKKSAQLAGITRRANNLDFSIDSWLGDTVINGEIEEAEDNRIPESLMNFSAARWAND